MKETIYNNSPILLQNYACSYQGAKLKKERLGGKFNYFLKEYLDRKDWSYKELVEYRDKKLHSFVRHAYESVPYYNKLFKELNIIPSDIRSIEDLKQLPILTKEEVRSNEQLFLSTKFKQKELVKINTSGSTGTSLQLFYTKDQLQEQFALWWKYRMGLGITIDTWCADFGSRTIVPQKQNTPPFWRISKPLKQIKFSAFHGNDKNYIHYYREIKRRKLSWIHGYPTVITPFAAFLNKNNLTLKDQIKFVTTGGENLYDFQREQMFQAFGTYPYNHYGLAECVANFSEDVNHTLTVDEDFAAVEFLPNVNGTYKIIGTNFSNLAMPLLRYNTNDLAVLFDKKEILSKRRVKHIDGRSGELLHLKSGEKIGALSALFSETSNIIEAQIYQRKDFSIEIRYVSNSSEKAINDDLRIVSNLLNSRLDRNTEFSFKKYDKLPRTSGGKLRYLISELDNNKVTKTGGV